MIEEPTVNLKKRGILIGALPAIIAALPMLQSTSAGAAAPLIQYVPKTALLYIGASGMPMQWPGYHGSNLQMLISQSPRLERLIKKLQSSQPAANSPQGQTAAVFSHPFAVYLTRFTGVLKDGNPDANLAIVIQAGKHWRATLAALNANAKVAGEARGHVGGIVYDIYQATPSELRLIHKKGTATDTLSADPLYRSLTAHIGPMSANAWYVNVQALSPELLHGQFGSTGAQILPLLRKVYKGSGLANYTAIAGGGGFQGADYVYHMKAVMTKGASNDRAGLKRVLSLVPENAASVATYHFDLKAIYHTIENVGKQAGFESRIKQGLTQAGTLAGISVRRDLINALGARWVTFTVPYHAGSYSPVSESILRSPNRVSTAIQSIAPLALMTINAARQQQNPNATPITLTTKTVGADTIYTIHGAGFAWCISGKRLILAGHLGVIKQVLSTKVKKSILDNPRFAAVYRKLAGDHALRDISWVDSRKLMAQSYLSFIKLERMIDGLHPQFARYLRPSELPKLSLLKKYQQFSQSAQWFTPHSWEMVIESSLPGGDIFTPQTGALMTEVSNPLVGKLLVNLMVPAFTVHKVTNPPPAQAGGAANAGTQ